MNDSCNNVNEIIIHDYNDSVDNMVHNQIKQLVRQSILMTFGLSFWDGNLFNNDDGL